MKMRRVYISVALFFVMSVALFTASFFYLDKAKRRTYLYDIHLDGRAVGTVRVDAFITDEKRIYKSAASLPFYPVFTENKSRIDLDLRYALENYLREKCASRACDLVYLENSNGLVSFVSRYGSYFACAGGIPIRKGTFVFEEDSPVTYMPIIENYDFSKGRSQGFNALTCPASPELPPMSRFVTLTSIKDEYLKVDSRRIKAENLILKIRNHPQGSIWVAKSDRTLLKIELPDRKLVITRSFTQKTLTPKDRVFDRAGYVTKDVSIKSKGAELQGTLTIPSGEGRRAAVLLLSGSGPFDRSYQGLFAEISDYLGRNGYCVLSLDKRSLGAKRDAPAASRADEIADASAAIQYLASLDTVDPGRIAIIGHDAGASVALTAASGNSQVNGLILMAPFIRSNPLSSESVKQIGRRAAASRWPDDYLGLIVRTAQETRERARKAAGAWVSILGKKCYAGDMLEKSTPAPAEAASGIKAPVLIMQGVRDTDSPSETAAALDDAFARSGNPNHTLVYYAYLGHYFGNRVNNGTDRIYYDIDEDVLANINDWLGKNLAIRQRSAETVDATQ